MCMSRGKRNAVIGFGTYHESQELMECVGAFNSGENEDSDAEQRDKHVH